MSSDPTHRFSDRAEDYARYRPGYPPTLIGLVEEHLGLDLRWVVVDLGSGTGLSSEPFLERGLRVVGVEPNAEMRAAAEARLRDNPGFTSVPGRAEDTGLPEASADLAIAGQAFHWFDVAATRDELLRILRAPRAVVFWNTRRVASTPFLRDYEELLLRYGTDYTQVRHDRERGASLEAFFQGGYRQEMLPHCQLLDQEGLLGRLLSSSYTPDASDPAREEMLAAAERLYERHQRDGLISLDYDTEVYLGLLAPLAGAGP
jgi:SAM-dependent methyltransferase